MAVDPRKRQKKLEKRKAKQKAERRELARRESGGLATQLRQAATAPILHCCVMQEIWSQGMGQLLISRQTSRGEVAFAAFLIDMYCLGVKDLFAGVLPRARYNEKLYDKLTQRGGLLPLKPECARKLVEGAVAYAEDLDFPPPDEYRAAKLIFGDIAAEACAEEFTFGKDGKPFYIQGPNDSSARRGQILRTLSRRLGGEDQFHYTVAADGPLPEELTEPPEQLLLPRERGPRSIAADLTRSDAEDPDGDAEDADRSEPSR